MRILIGVMLFGWVPFLAIAAETSGNFPVCHTMSATKEIWKAASDGDNRQIQALMKDQYPCFRVKSGYPLSIIQNFSGLYKIRVYVGDESEVLYTIEEGIKGL